MIDVRVNLYFRVTTSMPLPVSLAILPQSLLPHVAYYVYSAHGLGLPAPPVASSMRDFADEGT